MLLEAFPGQGGKEYISPKPELDLLNESLKNHFQLQDLAPHFKPSLIFGNSYGIYAAMVAAGVVTKEVALRLAEVRANLVRRAEEVREARGLDRTGMLALLGLDRFRVDEVVEKFGVYLTNINGPKAWVVSGRLNDLGQIAAQVGKRVAKLLPIEGAYHCPLREAESDQYGEEIKQFDFDKPKIPIVCSTKPRILQTVADLKEELISQMIRPVNLPEAVNLWIREGVSWVVDTGPGVTLKKLIQRININLLIFAFEQDREALGKME